MKVSEAGKDEIRTCMDLSESEDGVFSEEVSSSKQNINS